jgi:hypothetical protein
MVSCPRDRFRWRNLFYLFYETNELVIYLFYLRQEKAKLREAPRKRMARAAAVVAVGRVVLMTMLLVVAAAFLAHGLETANPAAPAEESTNLITLTSGNFDDVRHPPFLPLINKSAISISFKN